jgi:proline iminopeptidase
MRLCFLLSIAIILCISAKAQKNHRIETIYGSIHFQEFGNGIPILIINGGPGMSSEGFIPLAKKLSKSNKTILFDQRGTGLSTLIKIDSSTVTMDLLVDDMEVLRKHLGIDKWILFGHSFGGILAYNYTSKHPHRVLAMIQSSSAGMDTSFLSSLNITKSLTPVERDSLQYYTRKIRSGDTTYSAQLKSATYLAPAYVYNRTHIPAVAKRLTQGNSRINDLVWKNLREINYDVKPQLASFKMPVLIIHGKEGFLGLNIPQRAQKLLSNSKLIVLEKTKHYGWLDNPEKFFGAIIEFVNEL